LRYESAIKISKFMLKLTLVFALLAGLLACSSAPKQTQTKDKTKAMTENVQLKTATFGGGCFWCTEAVYLRVRGVTDVTSGYMGGKTKNPTYRDICTGQTGHAEVIQITFNPEVIDYGTLLDVFFHTHDPTTLNRQGNDVGTQYRSVVFYHSEAQKAAAEKVKATVDSSGVWSDPIVTEISAAEKFYPAEKYHQDYYDNNPQQGYCRFVINPKLDKFRKRYSHLLIETEDK